MNPQVIGLGQCSLDILGGIDSFPSLDQKTELNSLLIQGGGPVATALVTLSRFGVAAAMVGATGDDEFGDRIRQGLLADNVDCTFLERQPGTSSQLAFIAVDDEGHRNIFWHRGTAHPSLPDDMTNLFSGAARILHLDGLHLEHAFFAAKMARDHGLMTVLDAGTLRPGYAKLLPLIDHLVVSENFADQFIGRKDPQAALQKLSDFGAASVVITLGEHGCVALDRAGRLYRQSAFQVEAKDTTGCGDVFHGGYIFGLLQQWELDRVLRFASACAALKARFPGARTGIPGLEQALSFAGL